MKLAVARIGRPHGIKGEVTIETLTDFPEERFFPGATLECDAPSHTSLNVTQVRVHQGRWMLRFNGIDDRNGAERLRNARLFAEVAVDQANDEDGYHIEQLRGMRVVTLDDKEIGIVAGVLNNPGQDLLEVTTSAGERLIPMVHEFIHEINVESGEIRVELPEGLLE